MTETKNDETPVEPRDRLVAAARVSGVPVDKLRAAYERDTWNGSSDTLSDLSPALAHARERLAWDELGLRAILLEEMTTRAGDAEIQHLSGAYRAVSVGGGAKPPRGGGRRDPADAALGGASGP